MPGTFAATRGCSQNPRADVDHRRLSERLDRDPASIPTASFAARDRKIDWMKLTLLIAGVYNIVWGGFVVLFPLAPFQWAGIEPPRYPELWQCVGMIVGVYGIGYLIAAGNPLRHWPIVLVGFLGKIFGPIGFLVAALRGELPWSWGVTIVTNDLIWWVPFAAILYRALRLAIGAHCANDDSFQAARIAVENPVGSTPGDD